ncbi:hypothetical protein FRC17_005220 [Serendipita sp. 399]|nr:hypothetical protein FRC17_005220 [Serendipita sp. 399]
MNNIAENKTSGDSEVSKESSETYSLPKKQLLIILVGLIGSGKSTFSKAIESYFPQQFKRCNQDELRTRKKVEKVVIQSLSSGLSVIVDRTNIDQNQRRIWIDIGRQFARVDVWVVTRMRGKVEGTAKSSNNQLLGFSANRCYMILIKGPRQGSTVRAAVTAVLSNIDITEAQNSHMISDLALYVGLPLAAAAGTVASAHYFFRKS